MKKKIVPKKRNVKKNRLNTFKKIHALVKNPIAKAVLEKKIAEEKISLLSTRGELGTAPAHYSHGKFTPWEVIDDWKLDYFCGNAVKYVCRHKHKGKPVEDIQKAIDCLIKYKQNSEKEMK